MNLTIRPVTAVLAHGPRQIGSQVMHNVIRARTRHYPDRPV